MQIRDSVLALLSVGIRLPQQEVRELGIVISVRKIEGCRPCIAILSFRHPHCRKTGPNGVAATLDRQVVEYVLVLVALKVRRTCIRQTSRTGTKIDIGCPAI